jgi:methionyl-tRNA synthetase
MSKFYVTTSIPYVNGEPHLGHALEFIQADVLARYHRKAGKKVVFSAGTDEHGTKMAEKAAEMGMTPKAYVDKMSLSFKKILEELNISNNKFIRTTDIGHEQRAKIVWHNITKYLYKGKYVGWYCVGDEEFVTETTAKANKGVCPNHAKPYQKLEEENYFFKMSAFGEQILAAIESGEFKILPNSKRNEILSLIKSGLDDISVSRPKDKISWGIPVPGDNNHVMYVWFEALMNYITVLGYPDFNEFKEFWPADVQVVGKDIIRFHAAIWPAMLLALNLPLPKVLYVHGHIGVDGQKMSKSLGNSIAPKEILDDYGVEAFRYFFLRHISSIGDGDFSWLKFETAYNNELANELGNAAQRVAAMVSRYQKGIIGDSQSAEHDVNKYHEAILACRFDVALDEVWEQVRGLNQYIDEEKPWELAKNQDEDHLREVLAYCVGSLIEIANLIEPFLPVTAENLRYIFSEGIVRPTDKPLFPKIHKYTKI